MTHEKRLEKRMTGRSSTLFFLSMILATLMLGRALPAQDPPEFSEAEVFFELNDTDGDLGLHSSIDGGPYRLLTITDPRGRIIFAVAAFGRLVRQGLTQLAFESAEPSFDELPPEMFFDRFPEGVYRIVGTTRDWENFQATVFLSHVLAAPAENILISGVPAAEDCDAAALPLVSEPVIIDWDPVTESHPELGNPGPVEIDLYQLFVGDFSVDLPPEVTEFRVPAEVLTPGEEIKFEIIARTSTGNNTAAESCFVVMDP